MIVGCPAPLQDQAILFPDISLNRHPESGEAAASADLSCAIAAKDRQDIPMAAKMAHAFFMHPPSRATRVAASDHAVAAGNNLQNEE
jgi:hypothetical protein